MRFNRRDTPELLRLQDEIERKTIRRFNELELAPVFPDIGGGEGFYLVEQGDLYRVWRVQRFRFKGLLILADVSVKDDGLLWLHVSLSRADRIPDYADQVFVKERIIGKDTWAIAIFPEREKHVNIHKHCLHLWHCIEKRPFPEFSNFGSI